MYTPSEKSPSLIYQITTMSVQSSYKITVDLERFSDQNTGLTKQTCIFWWFVPTNLLLEAHFDTLKCYMLLVHTLNGQSVLQMVDKFHIVWPLFPSNVKKVIMYIAVYTYLYCTIKVEI